MTLTPLVNPSPDASPPPAGETSRAARLRAFAPAAALMAILAVAAVLRFSGIGWDENTHLHPDERFLTMVETGIRLPSDFSEFIDPGRSPLNPRNAGFTFFVYGTFPIFLVRYLAEWTSQIGYDQVHIVGRAAAALFDLLALLFLFALGSRLYGRIVGLLAALLGAFTVLLIQHAHFFVVDPFANFFVVVCLYLAVRVQDEGRTWDYALFGLSAGAAAASKISALPIAGVLVLAVAARVATVQRERRENEAYLGIRGLVLGGLATFLAFRILQPYAFQGPALWNILPNRDWLSSMQEVQVQSKGLADLPFALQWADRPKFLFGLRNMVLWGLGLPLGVVAWLSWGGALVQSLRGRWHRHLIPLVWTGAYFAWQGYAFTSAMRYFLPIYPTLILFAAWGSVTLWRRARLLAEPRRRWASAGLGITFGVLLAGHMAYGIGFARIYTTPITRVAASRWIYSHVPAAVNLLVEGEDGGLVSPLSAPLDFILERDASREADFKADRDGDLRSIRFPSMTRLGVLDGPAAIRAEIYARDDPGLPVGTGQLVIAADGAEPADVSLDPSVPLVAGESYIVRLSLAGAQAVVLDGDLTLSVASGDGAQEQTLTLTQEELAIGAGHPYLGAVYPSSDTVTGVALGNPRLVDSASGPARIRAELLDDPGSSTPLASAEATWSPSSEGDPPPTLTFNEPVSLDPTRSYWLRLEATDGSPVAARGSRLISESSWDDGLPLRLDGRDAFGGMYNGLNQEIYWSDNEDTNGNGIPDKQERLVGTLQRGDYLVITSNRQYGSIPRIPIRYPLTTAYYRALFDCPDPTPVNVCAARAQPSSKVNALGYRLIETFQSDPRLGPFHVNDQTAEEAFTVYDHPKVLIFERTPQFSADAMNDLLGAVDLSHIRQVIPVDAASGSKDLMLPPDRLAQQRAGGTWTDLFSPDSWVNRSQVLATIVWWLLIAFLGILAWPVARVALPGFGVGGYALSRTLGMLLLSWGVWFAGSYRVPFHTTTILGVLLLMMAIAGTIAYRRRDDLRSFLRANWREILVVEGLALGLFLLDLAIRYGNPDLWHPAKGGEKPMDFSYFNAVLRSTTFPPYDPWFSGGYINYYYYGFVLIGVPVKLLGINPAVAYNLILPTLFSLVGVGGFGVAYELARRFDTWPRRISPRVAGFAAAALLVLLGNLGTVQMAYQGLKRIGTSPGDQTHEMLAGIPQAARGLAKFLSFESPLPYRMDEWYWNPSRAIPAAPGDVDPITEFPFFTFLYADLHAHMIGLGLTILALGWAISWALAADERKRRGGWAAFFGVAIGGLIVGSLRPTNTWDFPVYLGLACLATLAAPFLADSRVNRRTVTEAVLATLGLLFFAVALYAPYSQWYVQGYTAADLWTGSRTTLRAYFTVHGVFLFFITAWMISETIRWMAETPLAALSRWRANLGWILGVALGVLVITLGLFSQGVRVALFIVPWMAWALVLFLRPHLPLAKRVVHVLVLAGLALTLVVEVVVLRGDIGRMNTVFKFYLQVWTLFSIAASVAFFGSLGESPTWRPAARTVWAVGGAGLAVGALLFPLTATPAKIRDRMAPGAPHTLDGTAFMKGATYYDQGGEIPLAEDLKAIHWLEENVEGSPVIVEGNIPEYRWGSRMTIYTGLPGVLGWNWHQRQQRSNAYGDPVTPRALDLAEFYTTPSRTFATEFLKKYDVSYVIVGGLERLYFEKVEPCWATADGLGVECDLSGKPMGMGPPSVSPAACTPLPDSPDRLSCPTGGLAKFEAMESAGELQTVYQDDQMLIYKVVR